MTAAAPTPAERFAAMEAQVAKLVTRVSHLEGVLARIGAAFGAGSQGGNSTKPEASDSELDDRFGNRTVRKDPKRWAGASYQGASFSQCPSEYLLVLADYLEWGADMDAKKPEPPKHNNGTPYFEYARKDARLARGWARRNAGKTFDPPASGNDSSDDGTGEGGQSFGESEEEIPF